MIGGALRKKSTKMIDTQTFPSKMIVASAETRFTEHNNLTTHFVLFTKRNSGRQEVQRGNSLFKTRRGDSLIQGCRFENFQKHVWVFETLTHYFQTNSTPAGLNRYFTHQYTPRFTLGVAWCFPTQICCNKRPYKQSFQNILMII